MGGVVLVMMWAYDGVTRAIKKLYSPAVTRHDSDIPPSGTGARPHTSPPVDSYLR
jgi:hypothetical protein